MNKTVEEPEIPSFSEYTKKALEEEDRKREEERKKKEEMKKVKLITCFHDSWIKDFFSRNFLCFVFLQGIVTEKDTFQPSKKWNLRFCEKNA